MLDLDCLQLVASLTVDFIPFACSLLCFFFAGDEVYHLSKGVRKGCMIIRHIYYQLTIPIGFDVGVANLNMS